MDNDPLEAQQTTYGCKRAEFRDEGTMQAPVAVNFGDGTIVESPLLRLHAPRHYVVISFVAQRWGGKPVVPNPDGLEANAKFLQGWRSGEVPVLDDSVKGHFWRVEGQYLYAKLQPPSLGLKDALQVGKPPYDSTITSFSETTIPAGNFVDYLTGQGP